MGLLKKVIFLACLLLLTSSAYGQDVFFFPQIGDGQVASIRFQTSIIFVNTGGSTTVTLEFFTSDGTPLNLTLSGLGNENRFDIALGAGESISAQTPGTGGLVVGYARITIPEGGSVGGTAVFTRTDIPSGQILYEAGVPAARDLNEFTIFVDTIGDRNTGLAIVNTDTGAGGATVGNLVRMTLYGTDFVQIATTDVPLAEGDHLPRFVPEIFDDVPQAAEMEGSVVVSSPDDLAGVTLRTNDAPGIDFPDEIPTLTTFPVVPGNAAGVASVPSHFTRISDSAIDVSLDLSRLDKEVRGGFFHLYSGGTLLQSVFRRFEDQEKVKIRLETGDAAIDRVDVELMLVSGPAKVWIRSERRD